MRKSLQFLMVLALTCFAFACVINEPVKTKEETKEPEPTQQETGTPSEEPSGYDFETVFNKVIALIGTEGVSDNINLPTAVGSVRFVWTSSDENTISNRGIVTRGIEDKEVTLTALMQYGSEQKTMSFTVKVLKTEEDIVDIITVLECDMTVVPIPEFSVSGTVIAVGSQSFLISDGTGMILVYRGYTWTHELEVGQNVLVSGTPTTYSGTVQFDASSTYTVIGTNTTFTQPEPLVLVGSDCDNYKDNLKHDYIQVTGKLAISGNYYNLNVDGASVTGSIVGPLTRDITNMNGKDVTVTGYVLYLTGSGNYLNILATNIEGDATPIVVKSGTITEAVEGELGAYEVSGTCCAKNAQSFLLTDGTNYILAFRGKSWNGDVNVGDVVKISGTTTTYNETKQFGNDAVYEITGKETYNLPSVKELSATDCDNYKNGLKVEYASFIGKLSTSLNSSGTTTYYNVTIDGASITGSIAYPIDDISSLDGKYIKVTGFILYTSGSGNYLNIMATEITESEGPIIGPTTQATITDIINGELGTYETTGEVVALNAQSFLLTDGTNFILCYRGKMWNADCKVGDKVTISGAITEYGHAKQFGTDAIYTVEKQTATYNPGEAKVFTAADCDGFKNNVKVQYMSVTGALAISGNYYNLIIDGAKVTGSIAYPSTDISSLDGKKVTVTGYALYTSGSDQYLNIMMTSIVEGEGGNTDPVEATISEIVNGSIGKYTTTGVVCAVYKQGFLLCDGANFILCYRGSNWTQDVEIEDTVTITGDVVVYGLAKQFGNTSEYTKGDKGTFNTPNSKIVLGADVTNYVNSKQIIPVLIEVKGELVISGEYVNLKINDTNAQGSIVYPNEDYTAFNGKYVKVTGYVLYTTSGGKYLNILATDVVETEGSYIEPEPITPPATLTGTEFDLQAKFADYNTGWTNSYSSFTVKTKEIGYISDYTIVIGRASKQPKTITDMPVCASKDTDCYVTITGDFSNATGVSFVLAQWTTKTLADIHIEYTTDGSTWIICSDKINTPTVLNTNISITGAQAVRLVYNGGNSGSNVQFGLQKIIIALPEE